MGGQKSEDSSKVLGRKDLFAMAVGQIIGVGVMSMTGVAIGMTGRSVNLAFILAGVITVFSAIPQIWISGTARFFGGQYSQIAVLAGQKFAGAYTVINLFTDFALAMFSISFVQYLVSLVPSAPQRLIAVLVLTVIFGMHLISIKSVAKMQTVMDLVLILALASFAAFGVGKIQPGYFSEPGFMSDGIKGFLLASVFLTFAAGGATYIVNYSDQAKNPTKDIPIVIAVSTLCVVALYAFMSTIAAGALPLAEVANQPLSVVAQFFMPKSVFTFFVVGGAMFALLTTMNFSVGSMTGPSVQAAKDGWLPKILANRNERFHTPHWALLTLYLIAAIPVVFGLDLSVIANSTVILTTTIRGLIAFSALHLPDIMPELWEKSVYHVSKTKLKVICYTTMVIAAISVCMLIFTTSKAQIIGNCAILAFAVCVALVRNKHVHLENGYEEL